MTRRNRHVRPIPLAAILVIGVTLFAAPTTLAFHTFVIPAGEGCAFDVLVTTTHREEAGERFPIGYGDITFTNVDTGTSYLQQSRYTATETFDPETNTVLVEITGRIWIGFLPGDQGPNGEVEEYLHYAFKGSLQYTLDLETGLFTAFSYEGTYVDICAELAE